MNSYFLIYGGSALVSFCLFMLSLARPNQFYQASAIMRYISSTAEPPVIRSFSAKALESGLALECYISQVWQLYHTTLWSAGPLRWQSLHQDHPSVPSFIQLCWTIHLALLVSETLFVLAPAWLPECFQSAVFSCARGFRLHSIKQISKKHYKNSLVMAPL